MDDAQKAAYITAMAACAQIEAAAMLAHNQAVPPNHHSRYEYTEFMALIDKYGIHHNAVLTLFQN